MLKLIRDDIVVVAPPPKKPWKRAIWNGYVSALISAEGAALLSRYRVNSPLRLRHALATMCAETGLALSWESGAYDADGIVRNFGWNSELGTWRHSAHVTRAEAERIAALPVNADGSGPRCEALFERIYGTGNPKKAKELGNTQPGDGWKFRGLGLPQATGREAHETAARIIGCSLTDLQLPLNSIHMFLIEWDEKNCNRYADANDAVSVRKLINAGNLKVSIKRINGLPEAMAALRRAEAVITDTDFSDDNTPVADLAGSKNAPASLMASTEMQAGMTTTGGGGYSAQQGISEAMAKTAATGKFDAVVFIMNLLSEPLFWVGAFGVAAGVYMMIKRSDRFRILGI